MSLKDYRKKRDFRRTPEPSGDEPVGRPGSTLHFCVQLHAATRRHFDLRLELDGTMKSWAVPKGPSLDPLERRLAVQVEDHPIAYCEFEGVIPKGNYGAGTVLIWDEGALAPVRGGTAEELRRGLAKGDLKFVLAGHKLKGEFALVRLKQGDGRNWLLLKKRDVHASSVPGVLGDRSVRTGRSLEEVAATAVQEGRIWIPGKTQQVSELVPRTQEAPVSSPPEASTGKTRRSRAAGRQGESTEAAPAKGGTDAVANLTRLLAGAEPAPLPRRLRLEPWRRLSRRRGEDSLPAGEPASGPGKKGARAKVATKPEAAVIRQPVYDGYRAQALSDGTAVRLLGANGQTLARRFPEITASLQKLGRPLALDGLIVPLDEQGKPRPRGVLAPGAAGLYRFLAYDLEHLDGFRVASFPLAHRLRLLAALPGLELAPCLGEGDEAPPEATGLLVRQDGRPALLQTSARGGRASPVALPPGSGAPQATDRVAAGEAGSTYEVVRLTSRTTGPGRPTITNRGKVFWRDAGLTKGDLIDYYRAVAPFILPHLRDRPESLNRHPHGIDGASFFQKEIAGHVPGWIATASLRSGRRGKTITYLLCQDPETLVHLANLGCIELNPWLSRVGTINSPDYVVIDLDPDAVPMPAVVEAALVVRELCEAAGVASFCKTSGSRGLHIYIPIAPTSSYDEVRAVAWRLCQEVHRRLPGTTSLERSPVKRRGLIYLDYLQNRIGQTMAAVYSARPKPGATVSMPLAWSEVTTRLDPSRFTIRTALARLAKKGDLWPLPTAAHPPLAWVEAQLGRATWLSADLPHFR